MKYAANVKIVVLSYLSIAGGVYPGLIFLYIPVLYR
jgi:hypothetical protein